ncbi:MAG: hypothetical protein ABMA01_06650 [Chthoniobacteraceae bacterium]
MEAYSEFITTGQEQGWWDAIQECGTFEGSTIAAVQVKLKAFPGSPPSATAIGVADSDVLANGGTRSVPGGYFSLGFNFGQLNRYSQGMLFWMSEEPANSVGTLMGPGSWYSTTPLNYIQAGTHANWDFYVYNQGEGAAVGRLPAYGFVGSIRSAQNSLTCYFNGRRWNPAPFAAGSTGEPLGVMRAASGAHFYAVTDGTLDTSRMTQLRAALYSLLDALGRFDNRLATPLRKAIIVGQSLGAGVGGSPALSTTPDPFGNWTVVKQLTIDGGPRYIAPGGERWNDSPTRNKELSQETIASEFQRTVSTMYRALNPEEPRGHDTIITNMASGAAAYSVLKKNGTGFNYVNSLEAISDIKAFADISHTGMEVPGLLNVHGETDLTSVTYQGDLEEWRADYDADIKAITGQTRNVVMFSSQPSSWTYLGGSGPPNSSIAMLAAHTADPTTHTLVCPKYFIAHNIDGVHLTNVGYRMLGAYYGKAWFHRIILGEAWHPLYPATVTRHGGRITATFDGRVGNLVFDTSAVSDPGNYGFEWSQTGGTPQTISSVTLSNNNMTVLITLTGDPGSTTTERLRYAYTGIPGNSGGPTTGPRGCLRDSDPATGYSGGNLYNWCVHFDESLMVVTPRQAWWFEHFGTAAASEGASAFGFDGDLDGLSNLAEYAFGGDPATNDGPELLPRAVRVGNNIEFTYRRAAVDVIYTVEQNINIADANGWVSVTADEIDHGDGTHSVLVPAEEPTQFLRIRVTAL